MLLIDSLIDRINDKASPIVVGLDPVIEHVPNYLKQASLSQFGNTPQAAAEALFQFNSTLLETLQPVIPAVKLQSACYELYGQYGNELFDKTVELANQLDYIVIDDAKRNDIGNTAQMYAIAHLGDSPLIEGSETRVKPDFLTINPLLGEDSIQPFVKQCQISNKGLFILVRTSNPSAKQYQEAVLDGKPLYQQIAGDVQKLSKHNCGNHGFSNYGAVVGATWNDEITALRSVMPNVFFLMPGYGAQGGTADQLVTGFSEEGMGVLVNASRSVIFAHNKAENQKRSQNENWASAALEEASRMRDDLLRSLKQAGKLPGNW